MSAASRLGSSAGPGVPRRFCSTWTSTRPGSAPAADRGEGLVVLAPLDDDADRLGVRSRRRVASASRRPPRGRQHRQRGTDLLDPLGVRRQRHEIGLGEVPVVVGLLLRAHACACGRRPRPSGGSAARPARPASISSIWRRASYSMARPSDRSEFRFLISQRVPSGSSPCGADRHVGVDPHRALLHLPVGDAGGHEDRPQLGDVLRGPRPRSACRGRSRSRAAARRPGCSRRGSARRREMRPPPPTWVDLPVSSSRWARSMPDPLAGRQLERALDVDRAGRTGEIWKSFGMSG